MSFTLHLSPFTRQQLSRRLQQAYACGALDHGDPAWLAFETAHRAAPARTLCAVSRSAGEPVMLAQRDQTSSASA